MLTISSREIEIGATGVIAKLMSSNLYLITTFLHTTLFFSAYAGLNPHTVNMWHLRLGHLGKQNVVKLADMSDGIDLTIPFVSDVGILYTHSTLQFKSHNNSHIPG